jgi:hypothetical protein
MEGKVPRHRAIEQTKELLARLDSLFEESLSKLESNPHLSPEGPEMAHAKLRRQWMHERRSLLHHIEHLRTLPDT